VQGASLASAAQPSGNQWLPTIFQKIVKLMSDSRERRVSHDPLPEEAVGSETELAKLEKKFFSQEEDYMYALDAEICDIIEKHPASFRHHFPYFLENVMPLMQRMEKGKLSLDREIVASIYADVVKHGGDKVKSDLMHQICNYFVSLTSPEGGVSLRHDGAYGIGACVMYGGQCFAKQDSLAAAAAKALMSCIVAAKISGNSSVATRLATDNCISALAKVCIICAGSKAPNLNWPEIFQRHVLTHLPLTADLVESGAVTNQLCGVLENESECDRVLGRLTDTLPQVLSVLAKVAKSPPTTRETVVFWNALIERIGGLLLRYASA
jgi:hypothetical protein